MDFLSNFTFQINSVDIENPVTSLLVEDITDLATLGVPESSVVGLFRLVSPSGIVLHDGTNFDLPDMSYGTSRVLDFGTLPEDFNSGFAEQGVYDVTQRNRVSNAVSSGFTLLSSNSIRIDGEFELNPGQVVTIIDAGINNGNYILSLLEHYNGETYMYFTSPLPAPEELTISSKAQFTNHEYFTTNFQINYTFQYPVLNLSLDSECDFGLLTFKDNTLFANTLMSDLRVVNLKYPTNMQTPKPDIVFSTASYNHSGDLWTGTWVANVTRTISLQLESNIFVETVLYASVSNNVNCEGSLCSIADCYSILLNKYSESLTGVGDTAKYHKVLTEVTANIAYANIIRSCGKSGYAEVVANVSELLKSCGCDCGCTPESNGMSQKVVPLFNAGTGNGGSVSITSLDGSITVSSSAVGSDIIFQLSISEETINQLAGKDGSSVLVVTGVPTVSVGVIDDIALSSNGKVYKKTAFGWIFQFNLPQGPAGIGQDGEDGTIVSVSGQISTDLPDASTRSLNDIHVLLNEKRSIYKRTSTGPGDGPNWTYLGDMNTLYRATQNTGTVLVPDAGGDHPLLIYRENRDVVIDTQAGNTYTIDGIKKMTFDGSFTAPIGVGEEIRMINVGTEIITIQHDSLDVVEASYQRHIMTMGGNNLVVPAGGSVTFKFIFINGSPNNGFYIVAKNF